MYFYTINTVLVILFSGYAASFTIYQNTTDLKSPIKGGRIAHPGEFPYYVLLKYDSEPYCGGVLISYDLVLTAAHCLINPTTKLPFLTYKLKAIAGVNHVNDIGQEIGAEEIHRNSNFNLITYHHDVGIIKLQHPFAKRFNIRPINLPEKPITANETVTVTGFGAESDSGENMSSNLKMFSTKILGYDECLKHFEDSAIRILPSEICVLSDSDDTICLGDSGGPMVDTKGHVVGIVSNFLSSEGNCSPSGEPHIYTSVYHQLKFIQAYLKN